MGYENKFVQVDGLKTRYIEDGRGTRGDLASWRLPGIVRRCF
jgi:hypothetical protein